MQMRYMPRVTADKACYDDEDQLREHNTSNNDPIIFDADYNPQHVGKNASSEERSCQLAIPVL